MHQYPQRLSFEEKIERLALRTHTLSIEANLAGQDRVQQDLEVIWMALLRMSSELSTRRLPGRQLELGQLSGLQTGGGAA